MLQPKCHAKLVSLRNKYAFNFISYLAQLDEHTIFLTLTTVIATGVTNNANPAMERPAVAQLRGIRTNKKQQCKLNYYIKLVGHSSDELWLR